MKISNSIIAGIALLITNETSAQLLSSAITNPSNGHKYYIGNAANWVASEALAVSVGGHLVTVNDSAENSWIADTFGMWGGTPRQLWLGLSDSITEGSYYWLSGEPSSFRNWAPGEPNNGAGFFPDEDGVTMWNPASGFPYGTWTDSPIDQSHFAIIEVVPEPSVFALAALAFGLSLRRHRQQTT